MSRGRRTTGTLRGRLPAVLVALIGVGLLLYPSAGNWFADRAHAHSLDSYTEALTTVRSTARTEALRLASQYNDRIGVQTLTDPYTDVDEILATSAEYESQLRVDGSDIMARVRIPEISVNLPIRHGTSEDALASGIGHLQGSSLPVGGASTNAVITGHSGLPNATLFTDLHSLVIGDDIYIDVLGRTMAYRIILIETVLPEETDLLKVVRDEDLLTLITCTPVGVNSHRLIIRAERVPMPDEEQAAAVAGGQNRSLAVPWWLIGFGSALVGAAGVLVGPNVSRRLRPELASGTGIPAPWVTEFSVHRPKSPQ